jgi:phosphoribosylformimino-5-aminoimidazole carboxamide ribotide isomerase
MWRSSMQIIPEIEIKQGMCVHAHHHGSHVGELIRINPLEVADRWINAGAERLHIIDVDGVISGRPENPKIIRQIKQKYPDIIIQSQGGLVDEDGLFIALDAGADYLVLSNKLTRKPRLIEDLVMEFPDKLIAAIDAQNGLLRTTNGQPASLDETLNYLSSVGVESIFFTEIPASGHVTPNNVAIAAQIAFESNLEVFANGGIAKMEELTLLDEQVFNRLSGLILGHAIYDETLDLEEAIAFVNQKSPSQYKTAV